MHSTERATPQTSNERNARAAKSRALCGALLKAFGAADKLPELVETMAPELWVGLCERTKVRVGNSAPLGSETRKLVAQELRETIALFRGIRGAA